ncbi:MAG: hypothetical protein JRJ85_11505 [Deltaproteobacteria bacterium]|nr:hypothetical protein [Deltaproteobacteria bacterium]
MERVKMKPLAMTFWLSALLLLSAPLTPEAANKYWDSITPGLWHDGANWNPAGEPVAGDHAYITNGGTAQITESGEVADYLTLGESALQSGNVDMTSGSLTTSREDIGDGGTGTFTQTGGIHSVTGGQIWIGLNTDSSGAYALSDTGSLSADYEYVGHLGSGIFTQTGGVNALTNQLFVGHGGGGSGTYELSGTGSLSAVDEYIGYWGTGAFTQTGGGELP